MLVEADRWNRYHTRLPAFSGSLPSLVDTHRSILAAILRGGWQGRALKPVAALAVVAQIAVRGSRCLILRVSLMKRCARWSEAVHVQSMAHTFGGPARWRTEYCAYEDFDGAISKYVASQRAAIEKLAPLTAVLAGTVLMLLNNIRYDGTAGRATKTASNWILQWSGNLGEQGDVVIVGDSDLACSSNSPLVEAMHVQV